MLISLIPFYPIYSLYNEEIIDSDKIIRKKINEQNMDNEIKFEIYENERWWPFVGWRKDLYFDEPQIWHKISKPKEYFDKNMIKLPRGSAKYEWGNDWQIECDDESDEFGWEYSQSFGGNFGRKGLLTKVRRRKWVRYAKKIES